LCLALLLLQQVQASEASISIMGKAKPAKHTAAEIKAKVHAATTNMGGGKAGLQDRKGGAVGHAKYKCPVCMTAAPDLKSMQVCEGLQQVIRWLITVLPSPATCCHAVAAVAVCCCVFAALHRPLCSIEALLLLLLHKVLACRTVSVDTGWSLQASCP
jgi:hypothetical protein